MSRFFSEPSALEREIEDLTKSGNTVYVARGVLKVKNGEDTIVFKEYTRFDHALQRPVAAGGYYATKDPGEIKRLDSIRDLGAQRFAPKATAGK